MGYKGNKKDDAYPDVNYNKRVYKPNYGVSHGYKNIEPETHG